MEFKIDTKALYSCITPVYDIVDANLTVALSQKYDELRQTGSYNLIINLANCRDADIASLDGLLLLHENMYSNDHSLVFTGINDKILQKLKQSEMDIALNLAGTIQEAIDIISMENVERDLYNEHDDEQ